MARRWVIVALRVMAPIRACGAVRSDGNVSVIASRGYRREGSSAGGDQAFPSAELGGQ